MQPFVSNATAAGANNGIELDDLDLGAVERQDTPPEPEAGDDAGGLSNNSRKKVSVKTLKMPLLVLAVGSVAVVGLIIAAVGLFNFNQAESITSITSAMAKSKPPKPSKKPKPTKKPKPAKKPKPTKKPKPSCPATVCDGEDACLNSTAVIKKGSCNGPEACAFNEGNKVDKCSCNGEDACYQNTGAINKESCNGEDACSGNTGEIRKASCNGEDACKDNTGEVRKESCNGDSACKDNTGDIRKASCNGEDACYQNTGTIGKESCNGFKACCGNTAPVGDGECNVGDGVSCCNATNAGCFCPTLSPSLSPAPSLV